MPPLFQDNSRILKYLQEIGEIPLLSPEREIELFQEFKRTNSQHAFNKILQANTKFAFSVAKGYATKYFPMDDAVGAANLGLAKAAYMFDETRGFKFISYAVWWIKQSVLAEKSYFAGAVRIPGNRVRQISRFYDYVNKFNQQIQFGEDGKAFRSAMDDMLEDDSFKDALRTKSPFVSLNSPLEQGKNTLALELIADKSVPSPDQVISGETLNTVTGNIIDRYLKHGPGSELRRQQEIQMLKWYIGFDSKAMTLDKIAQKKNIGREAVRKNIHATQRRIKKFATKEFPEYRDYFRSNNGQSKSRLVYSTKMDLDAKALTKAEISVGALVNTLIESEKNRGIFSYDKPLAYDYRDPMVLLNFFAPGKALDIAKKVSRYKRIRQIAKKRHDGKKEFLFSQDTIEQLKNPASNVKLSLFDVYSKIALPMDRNMHLRYMLYYAMAYRFGAKEVDMSIDKVMEYHPFAKLSRFSPVDVFPD